MGIFAVVGVPGEILLDEGSDFMSKSIPGLYKLVKVSKLISSPYHPQTNGLVETFNGTLKKMLKAYSVKEPTKWDKHYLFLFLHIERF
jgi:transposase InsO family protein